MRLKYYPVLHYLTAADVGSASVTVGEDDQGAITGLSYRTINAQLDGDGGTISVLVVERANVADYLLIPIDRDNSRVADGIDLPAVNYAPGESFDIASLSLTTEVVVNQPPFARRY